MGVVQCIERCTALARHETRPALHLNARAKKKHMHTYTRCTCGPLEKAELTSFRISRSASSPRGCEALHAPPSFPPSRFYRCVRTSDFRRGRGYSLIRGNCRSRNVLRSVCAPATECNCCFLYPPRPAFSERTKGFTTQMMPTPRAMGHERRAAVVNSQ